MNNESVGKKIVEALKKQAESMDIQENDTSSLFEESIDVAEEKESFEDKEDFFAEPVSVKTNFFEDIEEEKEAIFGAEQIQSQVLDSTIESFDMPANIAVLKKLISQLPSGVSRHTGAQIIKQTMEALGISMKSVLQDAQQVQENLKISARECQGTIQEYKKQILNLEKQSQTYQKQYSALNDLISLFIQTTK